ncbi:DUF5367 domain-containing protein [Granulicella aggregans]|jgi:glucose uptake protein GlcU|uniref:DUF5367 domain-containing protein n=1 Tax=Granulicella aggregans TaxID=474949 RepID=UPI0021DFDC17|nr:DUF5367 domain-containing protein [Granulicella aggregans]
MKTNDTILLGVAGLAFWILGTLLYRVRGQAIFETTSLRYWLNFVLTPLISAFACVVLFRWLAIPDAQWPSAALLIAIPGMIGEAVLLSNFSRWMPRMQPATAGSYSGFLFATYALVLLVAEIASLQVAA